MDGQPEYDKELSLSNTPLENLRSILSEADASAQTTPATAAEPKLPGMRKEDVRRVIDQLRAVPEQFLAPELIQQVLGPLWGSNAVQGGLKDVSENGSVISLEKWIQSRS